MDGVNRSKTEYQSLKNGDIVHSKCFNFKKFGKYSLIYIPDWLVIKCVTCQEYWRRNAGLTEVPTDIPADIKVVHLLNNPITMIPNGVFSQLSQCKGIYLHKNRISVIEQTGFKGLVNLKQLSLNHNELTQLRPNRFIELIKCEKLFLDSNKISTIHVRAFTGVMSLKYLTLHHNKLTTLDSKLFIHIPRPFTLLLGYPWDKDPDNAFQCDSTLCWLKQEERDATITWRTWAGPYKPECESGVDWNKFNCPVTGR